MDKKIKVVLTHKWWDTNRAKTLTDKGNLGKALKEFEVAFAVAARSKGIDGVAKPLEAAQEACKALREAAATTARACVTGVHGDTQWVLKSSFVKAIDEHEKALDKVRANFKAEVAGLKVAEMVKDVALRNLLAKQCKKEHSLENLEFLLFVSVGNKRDKNVFDTYVVADAPKQVNLPASIREPLEAASKAGKLVGCKDWDAAEKEIQNVMTKDTLPRLRTAILSGNV